MSRSFSPIATIILLVFSILLLTACSKPSIEGDVYIIKGDGSVAPSPGTTVYFIPYKTEIDLIYDLVSKAHEESYTEQLNILINSCKAAAEFVNSLESNNEAELNEQKINMTMPADTCKDLETQVGSLSEEFETQKTEHQRKVESLKKKLDEANSVKDFAGKTALLKKEELSKVEAQLVSQEKQGLDVVFHNRSEEFCLYQDLENVFSDSGLKIDAYAEENIVAEGVVNFGMTKQFDANGTLKLIKETSPCVLKPGESKRPSISWSWKGSSYFSRDEAYPSVTSLRVRNVALRELVTGEIVAINWTKHTSKKFDFSEADSEIRQVENALTVELDRFEKSSVQLALADKKQELNKCEKLSAARNNLQKIRVALDKCDSESRQINESVETLEGLNDRFDANLEIPQFEQDFSQTSLELLGKTFSSVNIAETDTSINGAYKISEITKGDYLVYSEYNDNFVNGFWLYPVSITESKKVDLNMKEFFAHSFIDYFRLQADKVCKECPIEEASIWTRDEADLILEKQAENLENLEKLENALDDLINSYRQ